MQNFVVLTFHWFHAELHCADISLVSCRTSLCWHLFHWFHAAELSQNKGNSPFRALKVQQGWRRLTYALHIHFGNKQWQKERTDGLAVWTMRGERHRKRKHSTIFFERTREGPSSIRQTLELFQRQCWGNFRATVWSACRLFQAPRYHLELSQTMRSYSESQTLPLYLPEKTAARPWSRSLLTWWQWCSTLHAGAAARRGSCASRARTARKRIQDSRLLYYLIREIQTWPNINHITRALQPLGHAVTGVINMSSLALTPVLVPNNQPE